MNWLERAGLRADSSLEFEINVFIASFPKFVSSCVGYMDGFSAYLRMLYQLQMLTRTIYLLINELVCFFFVNLACYSEESKQQLHHG
jgi:hypothetical protein